MATSSHGSAAVDTEPICHPAAAQKHHQGLDTLLQAHLPEFIAALSTGLSPIKKQRKTYALGRDHDRMGDRAAQQQHSPAASAVSSSIQRSFSAVELHETSLGAETLQQLRQQGLPHPQQRWPGLARTASTDAVASCWADSCSSSGLGVCSSQCSSTGSASPEGTSAAVVPSQQTKGRQILSQQLSAPCDNQRSAAKQDPQQQQQQQQPREQQPAAMQQKRALPPCPVLWRPAPNLVKGMPLAESREDPVNQTPAAAAAAAVAACSPAAPTPSSMEQQQVQQPLQLQQQQRSATSPTQQAQPEAGQQQQRPAATPPQESPVSRADSPSRSSYFRSSSIANLMQMLHGLLGPSSNSSRHSSKLQVQVPTGPADLDMREYITCYSPEAASSSSSRQHSRAVTRSSAEGLGAADGANRGCSSSSRGSLAASPKASSSIPDMGLYWGDYSLGSSCAPSRHSSSITGTALAQQQQQHSIGHAQGSSSDGAAAAAGRTGVSGTLPPSPPSKGTMLLHGPSRLSFRSPGQRDNASSNPTGVLAAPVSAPPDATAAGRKPAAEQQPPLTACQQQLQQGPLLQHQPKLPSPHDAGAAGAIASAGQGHSGSVNVVAAPQQHKLPQPPTAMQQQQQVVQRQLFAAGSGTASDLQSITPAIAPQQQQQQVPPQAAAAASSGKKHSMLWSIMHKKGSASQLSATVPPAGSTASTHTAAAAAAGRGGSDGGCASGSDATGKSSAPPVEQQDVLKPDIASNRAAAASGDGSSSGGGGSCSNAASSAAHNAFRQQQVQQTQQVVTTSVEEAPQTQRVEADGAAAASLPKSGAAAAGMVAAPQAADAADSSSSSSSVHAVDVMASSMQRIATCLEDYLCDNRSPSVSPVKDRGRTPPTATPPKQPAGAQQQVSSGRDQGAAVAGPGGADAVQQVTPNKAAAGAGPVACSPAASAAKARMLAAGSPAKLQQPVAAAAAAGGGPDIGTATQQQRVDQGLISRGAQAASPPGWLHPGALSSAAGGMSDRGRLTQRHGGHAGQQQQERQQQERQQEHDSGQKQWQVQQQAGVQAPLPRRLQPPPGLGTRCQQPQQQQQEQQQQQAQCLAAPEAEAAGGAGGGAGCDPLAALFALACRAVGVNLLQDDREGAAGAAAPAVAAAALTAAMLAAAAAVRERPSQEPAPYQHAQLQGLAAGVISSVRSEGRLFCHNLQQQQLGLGHSPLLWRPVSPLQEQSSRITRREQHSCCSPVGTQRPFQQQVTARGVASASMCTSRQLQQEQEHTQDSQRHCSTAGASRELPSAAECMQGWCTGVEGAVSRTHRAQPLWRQQQQLQAGGVPAGQQYCDTNMRLLQPERATQLRLLGPGQPCQQLTADTLDTLHCSQRYAYTSGSTTQQQQWQQCDRQQHHSPMHSHSQGPAAQSSGPKLVRLPVHQQPAAPLQPPVLQPCQLPGLPGTPAAPWQHPAEELHDTAGHRHSRQLGSSGPVTVYHQRQRQQQQQQPVPWHALPWGGSVRATSSLQAAGAGATGAGAPLLGVAVQNGTAGRAAGGGGLSAGAAATRLLQSCCHLPPPSQQGLVGNTAGRGPYWQPQGQSGQSPEGPTGDCEATERTAGYGIGAAAAVATSDALQGSIPCAVSNAPWLQQQQQQPWTVEGSLPGELGAAARHCTTAHEGVSCEAGPQVVVVMPGAEPQQQQQQQQKTPWQQSGSAGEHTGLEVGPGDEQQQRQQCLPSMQPNQQQEAGGQHVRVRASQQQQQQCRVTASRSPVRSPRKHPGPVRSPRKRWALLQRLKTLNRAKAGPTVHTADSNGLSDAAAELLSQLQVLMQGPRPPSQGRSQSGDWAASTAADRSRPDFDAAAAMALHVVPVGLRQSSQQLQQELGQQVMQPQGSPHIQQEVEDVPLLPAAVAAAGDAAAGECWSQGQLDTHTPPTSRHSAADTAQAAAMTEVSPVEGPAAVVDAAVQADRSSCCGEAEGPEQQQVRQQGALELAQLILDAFERSGGTIQPDPEGCVDSSGGDDGVVLGGGSVGGSSSGFGLGMPGALQLQDGCSWSLLPNPFAGPAAPRFQQVVDLQPMQVVEGTAWRPSDNQSNGQPGWIPQADSMQQYEELCQFEELQQQQQDDKAQPGLNSSRTDAHRGCCFAACPRHIPSPDLRDSGVQQQSRSAAGGSWRGTGRSSAAGSLDKMREQQQLQQGFGSRKALTAAPLLSRSARPSANLARQPAVLKGDCLSQQQQQLDTQQLQQTGCLQHSTAALQPRPVASATGLKQQEQQQGAAAGQQPVSPHTWTCQQTKQLDELWQQWHKQQQQGAAATLEQDQPAAAQQHRSSQQEQQQPLLDDRHRQELEVAYARAAAARAAAKRSAQHAASTRSERLRAELMDLGRLLAEVDTLAAQMEVESTQAAAAVEQFEAQLHQPRHSLQSSLVA